MDSSNSKGGGKDRSRKLSKGSSCSDSSEDNDDIGDSTDHPKYKGRLTVTLTFVLMMIRKVAGSRRRKKVCFYCFCNRICLGDLPYKVEVPY